MKLRCSSLPLAFACPPSTIGEGLSVRARNEAAQMGSGGHEAMTMVVAGKAPPLIEIAHKWGVDLDELRRLVWYGERAWEKLSPSFSSGADEKQVILADHRIDLQLVGHVDLMTPISRVVHGLDWKFGRLDHDYYHQVAGYSTCILLTWPEVEQVVFTVVWCRDFEAETYTFTREVVLDWAAHFQRQVVERQAQYTTGEHCAYCPRSHSCPAITALARRDVAIFGADGALETIKQGLMDLPSQELVDFFRRVKVVEVFAKGARESIRNEVRQRNAPQDAGDGTELVIVEQNGPRRIDPALAWEELSKRLTQAELAQVTEISASAVDVIVATNAGKGKGAAAKRELAEALERVNAIDQGRIEKMISRRKG